MQYLHCGETRSRKNEVSAERRSLSITDPLRWRDTPKSRSPPPQLPQSAPTTPITMPSAISTPTSSRLATRVAPALHVRRPSYHMTLSQPTLDTFDRSDANLVGQETLFARTETNSSLSRSVSLSETTSSGDSLPLLRGHRRQSRSLSLPRLRRDTTNPSAAPRKLQKRRTGSQDSSNHWEPVPDIPSMPVEYSVNRAQEAQHLASDPIDRKEDHGVHSIPPSLPEGAQPPVLTTSTWSLARNSSTSTQASSMIAPSTEESTVLTPPYDPHRDQRLSDRWEVLGIPVVDRLSRSSTLSYQGGDDAGKLLPSNEIIDMRQILSEGFGDNQAAEDEGVGADAAWENRSLISPPSLATMRSMSDTTVSFRTATEGTRPTATPSSDLQSLSSGVTSRPGSRIRDLPVDATSSPQAMLRASPSLASLGDSPSRTVSSSTSTPRSFGPISRFRRGAGHTRSRASSLSAISVNRASSYSVGEVTVADHGAMTPATTVRLPDLTPTPTPQPDVQQLLTPPSRPVNKRSHSDLGRSPPTGLLRFRSRESLKSSAKLVVPPPPPPLPRLRSAPSLEIITSPPAVDDRQDDYSPVVESPLVPARTSSLGRLWSTMAQIIGWPQEDPKWKQYIDR